jgi:hypothetical protein
MSTRRPWKFSCRAGDCHLRSTGCYETRILAHLYLQARISSAPYSKNRQRFWHEASQAYLGLIPPYHDLRTQQASQRAYSWITHTCESNWGDN